LELVKNENKTFKEMLLNELKNKDITIKELDIQQIVSTVIKEIDVKS